MVYSEHNHWEWHHRKMVGVYQDEKAKVAKLYMEVTALKEEIEILKEQLNEQNSRKD